MAWLLLEYVAFKTASIVAVTFVTAVPATPCISAFIIMNFTIPVISSPPFTPAPGILISLGIGNLLLFKLPLKSTISAATKVSELLPAIVIRLLPATVEIEVVNILPADSILKYLSVSPLKKY